MDVVERFFTARPQAGWLGRLPISLKYLLIMGVLVAIVVDKSWLPQACFVAAAVALYLSCGLGKELGVNLLLMLIPGVLVVLYHGLLGNALVGMGLAGVFFNTLAFARLLFLTTELPLLMEAIGVYLHPLRRLGINPRAVSLAMYLMIRTIPWLFAAATQVVQAHRARGIRVRINTVVTPTIIAAVRHAQETAEALTARNLG